MSGSNESKRAHLSGDSSLWLSAVMLCCPLSFRGSSASSARPPSMSNALSWTAPRSCSGNSSSSHPCTTNPTCNVARFSCPRSWHNMCRATGLKPRISMVISTMSSSMAAYLLLSFSTKTGFPLKRFTIGSTAAGMSSSSTFSRIPIALRQPLTPTPSRLGWPPSCKNLDSSCIAGVTWIACIISSRSSNFKMTLLPLSSAGCGPGKTGPGK
mmetsp:Transcript_68676/g.128123  ORF Transcript_68676/g.128123 Transcript_68676/m.128123 type:complete len:212 (+) Transcript_68676:131-766(+)